MSVMKSNISFPTRDKEKNFQSWNLKIKTIKKIDEKKMIPSTKTATTSVTRLGNFWNYLVTNFLTKVAQNVWRLLAYIEKHFILAKNVATFLKKLASFWIFWLLFLKKWAIPGLFFFIFIFSIHSWQ